MSTFPPSNPPLLFAKEKIDFSVGRTTGLTISTHRCALQSENVKTKKKRTYPIWGNSISKCGVAGAFFFPSGGSSDVGRPGMLPLTGFIVSSPTRFGRRVPTRFIRSDYNPRACHRGSFGNIRFIAYEYTDNRGIRQQLPQGTRIFAIWTIFLSAFTIKAGETKFNETTNRHN